MYNIYYVVYIVMVLLHSFSFFCDGSLTGKRVTLANAAAVARRSLDSCGDDDDLASPNERSTKHK